MAIQVYKTLLKVFGAVLVILGIAALVGGNFAHNYVRGQLADQAITMASNERIDAQLASARISEEIYYWALRTSLELAREKGAHPAFADTRTARGELQFDAWKVVPSDAARWDALREENFVEMLSACGEASTAQAAHRHEDAERALQGHLGGADRPDGRCGRPAVRRFGVGHGPILSPETADGAGAAMAPAPSGSV